MVDKMTKVFMTIIGMLVGVGIVALLNAFGLLDRISVGERTIYIYIALSLILGIISFILSNKITKLIKNTLTSIEKRFQDVPVIDIILGVVGLVVGLLIASLLGKLFMEIKKFGIGIILTTLSYILFGYLGIKIPTKRKDDIGSILGKLSLKKNPTKENTPSVSKSKVIPKILDTSVIIDGRILDICNTEFIEGPLVIPEFVLKELQTIADSSDDLKRNRGRRGLDILNKIQKEIDIEVIIDEKDFENVPEVDTKLLKLAQFIDGKVVTNDYNLNKVAEVHGVSVLNINELANAVKPVVLPGEDMTIQIIKKGKESTQGVAYLDDGTMIVVEGGSEHIGKTVGVLVTSVLQTAAGRMIFAKPKTITNKAV